MRRLAGVLRPLSGFIGLEVRTRFLVCALLILVILSGANIAIGVLFGSCGVLHAPTVAGTSTVGGFILRDLGLRTIWQSS